MAYVALLDASVLHPWVICDLLLRLAERGLYRPAWSGDILDELVESLTERKPEHAERFERRREHMEAAFAEAMAERPRRFLAAVPEEVDAGDRHVVAAALAARADVIVTNNVRHFAADRLGESGLLVQTADELPHPPVVAGSRCCQGGTCADGFSDQPATAQHDPGAGQPRANRTGVRGPREGRNGYGESRVVATSLELVLRPAVDLASYVGDRRIVATGVGDGNRLVALLGTFVPGQAVDPSQPFILGGEHDPRIEVTSALFAEWPSKSVKELPLEPLKFAFPVVQPLPNGGLLVADSRVAVRRPPNGRVIGPEGKVRSTIMFGDGIEHMLVDRLGRAWVGYSDEGVFGNLGWSNPGSPRPIGSPGLVRFDLATGEIEWAFEPPDGSDSIADCYALNVDVDHVCMSYYTDFDLYRIDSDGGIRRWEVGARGPRVIASDGTRVLLVGGYESRLSATLWNVGKDRLANPRAVRLRLEGDLSDPNAIWGRGPKLHAIRGSTWFAGDLEDITGEGQPLEVGGVAPDLAGPGRAPAHVGARPVTTGRVLRSTRRS